MATPEYDRISKFLSFVLRHEPAAIGLQLDGQGWASVDELLAGARSAGHALDLETLRAVVAANAKQRFAFSEDGRRIRANQGHSIDVQLRLPEREPPEWLYHGTVERFWDAIAQQGLVKGSRHAVHLSVDRATAAQVGARRGAPMILVVAARRMWQDGHVFHCSANGVWLTDHVPSSYLSKE